MEIIYFGRSREGAPNLFVRDGVSKAEATSPF